MITKAQQVVNLLRSFSGSDKRIQPTSAVIVAAGSSSRMGEVNGVKKQHIELYGIPVVVRSMQSFEACRMINEIVIVAREDEISLYDEYKKKYNITKLTHVVAGGNTRQESVLNGIEAINPDAKFIAIHDGARCLVTVKMIEDVCLSAYRYRAATAATAVRDTVKVCDKHGFIDTTIDRNTVWLAQTPQVFYANLYRAAAYSAREAGFDATDDNSLVERIENPVKLVECGRENIKLTTPDDIALAEHIIRTRKGSKVE